MSPKWLENQAYEVYIQHTSKSISVEHAKKDWWEISGNFFRKWPKTRILTQLGDPKWAENQTAEAFILDTSKRGLNHLRIQVQCESSGNFLRKWPKTKILPIWGPKMTRQPSHRGLYFTHI